MNYRQAKNILAHLHYEGFEESYLYGADEEDYDENDEPIPYDRENGMYCGRGMNFPGARETCHAIVVNERGALECATEFARETGVLDEEGGEFTTDGMGLGIVLYRR